MSTNCKRLEASQAEQPAAQPMHAPDPFASIMQRKCLAGAANYDAEYERLSALFDANEPIKQSKGPLVHGGFVLPVGTQ